MRHAQIPTTRLLAARLESGLTVAELALLTGVTEAQIYRYQRGEVVPSQQNQSTLARLMRRHPLDLWPQAPAPAEPGDADEQAVA
jgi:transcriptional regulator with XRE-family HTH domain